MWKFNRNNRIVKTFFASKIDYFQVSIRKNFGELKLKKI